MEFMVMVVVVTVPTKMDWSSLGIEIYARIIDLCFYLVVSNLGCRLQNTTSTTSSCSSSSSSDSGYSKRLCVQ